MVCRCCGSGWSIDQDQLDEPIDDAELSDPLDLPQDHDDEPPDEPSLSELWADADAAARVGETPARAKIRTKVLDRLHESTDVPSVPQLLGELSIDPCHAQLVADVVAGEVAPSGESFRRPDPIATEWHLESIIDRDGETHRLGDGGVDMVSLHLPVRRLL